MWYVQGPSKICSKMVSGTGRAPGATQNPPHITSPSTLHTLVGLRARRLALETGHHQSPPLFCPLLPQAFKVHSTLLGTQRIRAVRIHQLWDTSLAFKKLKNLKIHVERWMTLLYKYHYDVDKLQCTQNMSMGEIPVEDPYYNVFCEKGRHLICWP